MICGENSHFGRIRRSAVDYVTVPLKYLKLSWKETTASGSMKKSS
jgi:hypothetical protein